MCYLPACLLLCFPAGDAQGVSALVQQLEPPAIRPINLANFAEHLLIWALGPLREAAGQRVSPHSLAPEAAFLPVVVMRCAEAQLRG